MCPNHRACCPEAKLGHAVWRSRQRGHLAGRALPARSLTTTACARPFWLGPCVPASTQPEGSEPAPPLGARWLGLTACGPSRGDPPITPVYAPSPRSLPPAAFSPTAP